MQKAFTLVELLCVVVVIALLMTITIPVLSHARSYSQNVVCQSNHRQLHTLVQAYAMDTRRLPLLAPLITHEVYPVEVVLRCPASKPFQISAPYAGYYQYYPIYLLEFEQTYWDNNTSLILIGDANAYHPKFTRNRIDWSGKLFLDNEME